MTRRPMIAALAAMCCLLAGCPPSPPPRTAYEGPTLPLSQLVDRINRNNHRIATLWARVGSFTVKLLDEKGQPRLVSGDGNLQYAKPRGLRLIGKGVFSDLFDIGSNDERYWMTVPVDPVSTMWFGTYAGLDQVDPSRIPIMPDLLLQVLAIDDINPNLLAMPSPVLRFNPDADAYMLVWIAKVPGRLLATREVWYDRRTLLPVLVLLFDDNGRVQLRAYLSEHEPVKVASGDESDPPRIATRYALYFPKSKTKLSMKLRDMTTLYTPRRGMSFPNARSFAFPDLAEVAVKKKVNLDDGAR